MSQLAPATLDELVEAVRATPRLLAVGAETKPRLSAVSVPKLSMRRLSGIIEYDPGEFTFTALAGTPLREIVVALDERRQYLPFDPMLVDAGATLGGTVAAGLNGPGRFRYGGIRDFILGVRFVDGTGRLLRMGGKVVKNAAGFDLPKFFVSSLGRFGVLAEITFKVFPRAACTRTLKIGAENIDAAARILMEAANTRWELDALELLPDGRTVIMRLAAPTSALSPLAADVLARWPGVELVEEEAAQLWDTLCEMRWAHANGVLVKVPTTCAHLPQLYRALSGGVATTRIHTSAGGNVAFISAADFAEIDGPLRELRLRGLAIRGTGPLWYGARETNAIARAVKDALDPTGRFPPLDE